MSVIDAATMPNILPAPPRDRRLRMALRIAGLIRTGTITLVMPDGTAHRVVGGPGPSATFILHDPRVVSRFVVGGDLGLAEAYLDGWWDSPDIGAIMAVAAANEAEWDRVINGKPWMRAMQRVMHAMRPNTRNGARRNIAEHYDLGNEFYSAWLDRGMTYSAAMFDTPDSPLEQAQLRKMRHLCDLLGLAPGMRVLEIGCGWGGFAETAARDYGCDVVALTLSQAQHEFAARRIADAGLAGRVEIRLQDYRDVRGRFDRIASIEMFEAVGEAFWPTYFGTLRNRLVPGGRAGLQVITIADRLFPRYRRRPDFIQRHVFPGGMLPSPSELDREIRRAGLEWRSVRWFGLDYAETLARWQAAFQASWPLLAASGRSARFKRLWEYYLHYCETGFRAGWTDVGQMLLARPD